ncbi:hypothetical protein VVD49_14150 [Uliginosibacterium sp. H3]|uniref:PAS domain-containing protein n=1 Tax=Uliginosibacterium silvisoli TaxID=3114758 RepID=A0ABU6K5W4_9RHOO|nr:hypothetical protein [Uliginosibacterium sp. H3]
MRISHYFEDLLSAYSAELEDLQTDSEGKNVLPARLKEKRSQFSALLSMIDFAPEMVAPVFHGGISFINPHALTLLSSNEPDEFPLWDELEDAVRFETWAEMLAIAALREPGGEQFMTTVICLEFLHERDAAKSASKTAAAAVSAAHDDGEQEGDKEEQDHDAHERDDDFDGDERDLDEAGAGWMEEQGFDRRE